MCFVCLAISTDDHEHSLNNDEFRGFPLLSSIQPTEPHLHGIRHRASYGIVRTLNVGHERWQFRLLTTLQVDQLGQRNSCLPACLSTPIASSGKVCGL
jgi:hypothetical protein